MDVACAPHNAAGAATAARPHRRGPSTLPYVNAHAGSAHGIASTDRMRVLTPPKPFRDPSPTQLGIISSHKNWHKQIPSNTSKQSQERPATGASDHMGSNRDTDRTKGCIWTSSGWRNSNSAIRIKAAPLHPGDTSDSSDDPDNFPTSTAAHPARTATSARTAPAASRSSSISFAQRPSTAAPTPASRSVAHVTAAPAAPVVPSPTADSCSAPPQRCDGTGAEGRGAEAARSLRRQPWPRAQPRSRFGSGSDPTDGRRLQRIIRWIFDHAQELRLLEPNK